MLGLALMLVHSLMAGILFLAIPAVLICSLLGPWSLGTIWFLLAFTSSIVFSTVFFLWSWSSLWFSAMLRVRPD